MHRDWNRIFPTGRHRWTMGLRPATAAEFFAPTAKRDDVVRERARWLAADFAQYAAVPASAEGPLEETAELLAGLGLPKLGLPGLGFPIAAGSVAGSAADGPKGLLAALGVACEADLVWLEAGSDGAHRLTGGVVCFPSSWALTEKLGKPMRLVHEPVPKLDEQLGRQIDSFLAKLEPGAAWTRENWSLTGDGRLNHHPSQPHEPLGTRPTAERVWIRLEHQLLLRLPRSRGVLFAIHVDPVPLTTVLRLPETARRLSDLLSTMDGEALAYKRLAEPLDGILEILRGAATPTAENYIASDESGGAI